MNYSIENEYLKITVSDLGAELISVVSKKDGCEYPPYERQQNGKRIGAWLPQYLPSPVQRYSQPSFFDTTETSSAPRSDTVIFRYSFSIE